MSRFSILYSEDAHSSVLYLGLYGKGARSKIQVLALDSLLLYFFLTKEYQRFGRRAEKKTPHEASTHHLAVSFPFALAPPRDVTRVHVNARGCIDAAIFGLYKCTNAPNTFLNSFILLIIFVRIVKKLLRLYL